MKSPLPTKLLALILSIIVSTGPAALAELHITEFMVDNKKTIEDTDGDASDWIEIFNSGSEPVNLEGYFLTDAADALTMWSFPAVEIAENGFLLVFASGKDRRDPEAELHTNFKLSSDGEYLALVDPNGDSVIAAFGTEENPLPEQFEDSSYGLMQGGGLTPTVFIGPQPQARVLVPSDDSLGGDWTMPEFEDSEWGSAQMGIGYDENNTYAQEFGPGGNLGNAFNNVNTSVYIRVPFEVSDPSTITNLTLKMKYDDGFVAYLNDTLVADANAPGGLTWESEATGNHSDNEAVVFQDWNITSFVNRLTAGTNIIAIHGLNDNITSSDMLITAELRGTRITDPSLGDPGYLALPSPRTFNGDTFGGFVSDTSFNIDRGFFEEPFDLEITTSTEGAEIRYTIDGNPPSTTSGQVYTGPIRIAGTTVVRAMAHLAGLRPTNVDTQTYLFPEDVVDQSRMRTSVTQSATLGPQMVDSLKAVPTVSIVTDNPGPFQNEGGSNIRSESPASVEMIFPDGTPGFQENAGLKHFGGYYTNFPKKSFRIGFRSQYGATKINYPLFDGFDYKHYPPTDRFDIMDLRSGSHDMRSRGAYMSNRFTDDSMLDMGNLAPHGRFVHVYLNGSYWGQYHLRERWNADMASSYLGGPKEDYDVVNLNDGFRNDEKVYDGDGVFWNEAKALASSGNPWANNDNNIDVANLIDFMLLWVSGDSESEVRLMGSKAQGQPFRFQMKDADGYLRPTGKSVTHQGPLSLMSRLRSGNTDFAMLLADRIHKHFFNNGALTPAKNIERLQKRVDEAQPGFIAESARWGNRFREYQDWLNYQQNLVNNHFPGLAQTMISRFRSAGMYPNIIAPVFSQHGGSIASGAGITMTTDSTSIYYTIDGSDPRLPGGAINPLATIAPFAGDTPNPRDFMTNGHVWKYLDDGSDQGTTWRTVNFDDSGWAEGPSELGYAEGDEATQVAYIDTDPLLGGVQRNATTYFRTNVEIADPSSYSYFVVKIKYDDAAAVYANGTEILRTTNLPASADFNTFASRGTPNEKSFFNFQVPSSKFVDGINSLAVEIHNASPASSDISFDMVLRGEVDTTDGDRVTKPVIISEPAILRARARNVTTGQWSALNEAFFSIDSVPASASNLVISELHYHPSEPSSPGEIAVSPDRDDYEFVEFLNTGDNPVDLTKVYFIDGITFAFPPNTILDVGKRLVIVRNLEAFTSRYGSNEAIQLAGEYSGRLSNDGEHLALFSDVTGDILDFTYNDQVPWPTLADGVGHSLVAINSLPSEAGNWGAHALVGGAPGYPDDIITSGYLAWKNANGINSDLGDADEDGIPNLAEYGFGTNPRSSNAGAMSDTSTITLGNERYLTITYQKNLTADDVQIHVQSSPDLKKWTNNQTLITVSEIVNPDGGSAIVTRRSAKPVAAHDDTYLRVIVTL